MPNYLEIGEVGLVIAREQTPRLMAEASEILTREVTTILEGGTVMSRQHLPGLSRFMTQTARQELPEITRSLGLKSEAERGTLIIGRPVQSHVGNAPDLKIYEPNRNITIYGDGSVSVHSPTPSGQRVMTENFNLKGPNAKYNRGVLYDESLKDSYPVLPDAKRPGIGMLSTVITHGDSRQFGVGMMNWENGRQNFMPAKEIVDAIRGTQPVSVSSERVSGLVGRWVSNPQALGWLIGFDKKAGEAIVAMGNWPIAEFEWWRPANRVVKSLDGLYRVELSAHRSAPITAYRDAVGHLFQAEEIAGGYKLAPAANTFAFKPSEVGLGYENGPMSQVLGLNSNTGLRAMGGYRTDLGGRIPIDALNSKAIKAG